MGAGSVSDGFILSPHVGAFAIKTRNEANACESQIRNPFCAARIQSLRVDVFT